MCSKICHAIAASAHAVSSWATIPSSPLETPESPTRNYPRACGLVQRAFILSHPDQVFFLLSKSRLSTRRLIPRQSLCLAHLKHSSRPPRAALEHVNSSKGHSSFLAQMRILNRPQPPAAAHVASWAAILFRLLVLPESPTHTCDRACRFILRALLLSCREIRCIFVPYKQPQLLPQAQPLCRAHLKHSSPDQQDFLQHITSKGHLFSLAQIRISFWPRKAASAHVLSSHERPFCLGHEKNSRRCRAAFEHVKSSQGHSFSVAQMITYFCSLPATSAHVASSQGEPFCLALLRHSTCSLEDAHENVDAS